MASLADVFNGAARWCVEPCDCRFGMACMPSDSVDAIVCDPPYELGFMGRRWDSSGIAYDGTGWTEALRILKPGGHLLAFGGTRTYHRMACVIEDVGFEIRDSLVWMYGSGFPKSLDVAKQLDKQAGHWRGRAGDVVSINGAMGGPNYERTEKGGPVTAAAAAAAGFGTALKPAFEPIVMARKPLDGTVAANWTKHGTGALNIDGCRIDWASEEDQAAAAAAAAQRLVHAEPGAVMSGLGKTGFTNGPASLAPYLDKMGQGRWPANVLLDTEAAALLDAQAGEHPGMSGGGVHRADYAGGMFGAIDCPGNARNDSGGPSRFFYTAKASRSEREAGLDDFAAVSAGAATGRADGSAGLTPRAGAGRSSREGVRNTHPTVKPVDVMRWLVRLVTRPGSLVLDPFTGSGSTGVATMLEGDGRRFVGLELSPLHVDFARARIAHVVGGTWERETKQERPVEKKQPSLFDAIGAGK